MGKADLGEKLTCSSCGARYYDLNKTPALCPKCGAENARPKVFKTKKAEAAAKPVKDDAPAGKKAAGVDDDDVEDIEDIEDVEDEDDDLLNDDDDLDEDDDVGSVIGPIDSDKESDI